METIAKLEEKLSLAVLDEADLASQLKNAIGSEKEELQARLDAATTVKSSIVLSLVASITDVIGNMQGNIDRIEREGTTGAPALDSESEGNIAPVSAEESKYAMVTVRGVERRVKTQYQITKEILADHIQKRTQLEEEYTELFMVEEAID